MRWRGSMLLLLAAGVAWGQESTTNSLTVFVRENNSSGRPFAGVQISAMGANGGPTGADGRKTLVITGHQPGDDLEVAVYKEGYEVVNDLERNVTLPRKRELHLFLCEPARCLEKRLSFYRLSAEPLRKSIEERYQKSLDELATKGLSTAEELGRAQAERDQALATVDRLTEELAQLKPGEGSSSYRRAVQLFTEGKLEEALQELDAAKLDQARQQVRSQLEDVTQRYILRGQILVAQFRFIEAETAFKDAAATSPDSLDAAFELARLLQKRNQFAEATAAFERGLKLAREARKTASTAAHLSNLGVLYRAQNRMDDARKAHEEALGIRRQLAAQNPEVYLPYVATTLNNLGVLHSDQYQMKDAQKAYEEALGIRRQLAAQNPEVYLPDVAMTLNNLGVLHSNQNQMDDARKAYGEALESYRQLAAKNPEVYLPHVAITLNNLGVLHSDQHRMDDARKAYEGALESYRQLAAKSPEVHLPNVAMALNNLGVLHSDQNRMDDARKAYEETLESYRQLAAKSPEVYLPKVAMALNNLGVLHRDQNWIDDARKAFEEAMQIQRDFAAINPKGFLPLLAQALEQLGILEMMTSQFEAASVFFVESLATRNQAASLGQPQKTAKIAQTTYLLALSYARDGEVAKALPAAQEALSLIDTMDAAGRNAFAPMVEELRKILAAHSDAAPKPAKPQPEPQRDDRDSGSGSGFVPPSAEQRLPMSVRVW